MSYFFVIFLFYCRKSKLQNNMVNSVKFFLQIYLKSLVAESLSSLMQYINLRNRLIELGCIFLRPIVRYIC